ncbi:MAG: hypothetical protein QOF76_3031 [Solirubrobacteraceae bacterium]|jgi:hypothetical protein|nr:hypothetical protein [Solirubrobacteraceae bacterium]
MEAMHSPVPEPAATTQRDYTIPAAAVAIAVVGSIGPWATVPGYSKGGLDGDGSIVLGLAIVAAIFVGVARLRGRAPSRVALAICGLLIAAIGIIDIDDVNSKGPTVGWGLWVTLVGGIAIVLAVLVRFLRR